MRTLVLRSSALILALSGYGALLGLAGCGSIEPVAPADPPTTDPTKLYSRLVLNYPAVHLSTVAPYDTVRLAAVPLDVQGNPMTGLPAPTYLSKDTARVKVTADGLVTALVASGEVQVIASLTAGPVTYADTARITVTTTSTPPKLGSLSLDVTAPDSTTWALPWPSIDLNGKQYWGYLLMQALGLDYRFGSRPIVPYVTDTAGNPVTLSRFDYTSLDPLIADFASRTGPRIDLIRPGEARLVVKTFAYGVAVADTLTVTVTSPTSPDVVVVSQDGTTMFLPSLVRIPPYGIVFWRSFVDDSVDVTFDGPSNTIDPPDALCLPFDPFIQCGVGDVLVPPYNESFIIAFDGSDATTRIRQFRDPGVYTYHSTRTGATGTIIVE